MKKLLYPFVCLCLCLVSLLTSCSDSDEVKIAVEQVMLDRKTLFLRVGEETLLQATVMPENATEKYVQWESTDAAVVQVKAGGVIRALKEGNACIRALVDGKQAECRVYVLSDSPSHHAERTVLVYMAADNNLGSFNQGVHFAEQDVEEMKAGMRALSGSGFHFLIYKDFRIGTEAPVLVELVQTAAGTVEEKVIRTYDVRNSVGVEEMQEVFGDVFGNPAFQANSYGLVYWSHGEGWFPYPTPRTRWIGQDDGQGDQRMNLSEFAQVLASVPQLHFDFIMFDACFMQAIEVLYELRQFTDYFIASPTETPGPGAPYEEIVPYMFVNRGANELAEAYFQVYNRLYNGGVGNSNAHWTGGVSMTVTQSAALDELAAVTRRCLAGKEVPGADALRAVLRDKDYDKRLGRSYHIGYYDWPQLMQCLLPAENEYATWKTAYDAAVAFWKTTPENYSGFYGMFSMEGMNGVSHYIPKYTTGGVAAAYRSMAWYEAAGLSQIGW